MERVATYKLTPLELSQGYSVSARGDAPEPLVIVSGTHSGRGCVLGENLPESRNSDHRGEGVGKGRIGSLLLPPVRAHAGRRECR